MNYKYITADGHEMQTGESMYRITNNQGTMYAVPQEVGFLRKTVHNKRDASKCPYDEKLIHYFDKKKALQAIAKVITPVEEVKPIAPEPMKHEDGVGYHHRKQNIKIKGVSIVFAGLLTGCGLGQIYGVAYLPQDTSLEDFQPAIKAMEEDYLGGVIATLGDAHYEQEELILSLGFERMAEYRNTSHTRGTQRLYFLKLNKNNQ